MNWLASAAIVSAYFFGWVGYSVYFTRWFLNFPEHCKIDEMHNADWVICTFFAAVVSVFWPVIGLFMLWKRIVIETEFW